MDKRSILFGRGQKLPADRRALPGFFGQTQLFFGFIQPPALLLHRPQLDVLWDLRPSAGGVIRKSQMQVPEVVHADHALHAGADGFQSRKNEGRQNGENSENRQHLQ